jgi:hypothetical protein
MRSLVELLMRYELRRAFRRVCWVGEWPPDLPDGPVICYANHHHFYDGHLLWLLLTERLGRPSTLWMAEWDRFPFFAAVGVQPFPPDAPRRRAATLRRTARRFRETPETVLVYFPEGTLHSPDEGLRPFPAEAMQRFGRMYASATWWPVALHVTWFGEAAPTALLASGAPHPGPEGARQRLGAVWRDLRSGPPATSETGPASHTLLEGRSGPGERWNFSFAAPLFERYL